jgi:hypothetical protein
LHGWEANRVKLTEGCRCGIHDKDGKMGGKGQSGEIKGMLMGVGPTKREYMSLFAARLSLVGMKMEMIENIENIGLAIKQG